MTQKGTEEDIKVLKSIIQEGHILIGTQSVLKKLRNDTLSKIYLANNCPEKTKQDILYYSKLKDVPVVETTVSNEELGIFCKKGYFISVIGVE